jgi:pimeloyl-ACP methyl ester carboxylesterase
MRATERGWFTPVRALSAVLAVAALLSACGDDGSVLSEAPSGSKAVDFESDDGIPLEGRLFGQGSVGVVLSHMRPSDQTSWWGFAQELADEGYLVLTYNARGYCPGAVGGCSGGDQDLGEIWRDVLGAVTFLRSEGARRISLVGASMGGTASLYAAAQEDLALEAIVTLSAPASFEGMDLTPDVLTRIAAAKLFVAGVDDGSAAESAQMLYDHSPPPKRLEILTTGDHGTDILEGNQAGPGGTLLLNYLAQHADA